MNGLLGFIVGIVVLFACGAIFFISIDKVAKDAFLAQIAKIVVGALILIALIYAVAGVLGLGGGGLAPNPWAIVTFAVGVLVLIVVLFLIDLFLNWLAANMGVAGGIVQAVNYIIAVCALIALVLVAGYALLGGGGIGRPFHVGYVQSATLAA